MSHMTINSFSPVDMSTGIVGITGVSLGNVVRGGYTPAPLVVQPVWQYGATGLSRLFFFLESVSGLNGSSFRYMKSAVGITGIGSGSPLLNSEFTEMPGVIDFSGISGMESNGITLTPDSPEFIYTDVKVGTTSPVGQTSFNYRVIFEYA